MTLTVIDHTEPRWQLRYTKHGRVNGAATYSRELVEHQAPLWADAVGESGTVTVSTCPLLHGVPDLPGGNLAVQYLHEYPLEDPLRQARKVAAALTGRYDRIVFVTAYRPLQRLLTAAGLDAVWVPMSIDTNHVLDIAAAGDPGGELQPDPTMRVAYYGNLIGDKVRVYHRLRRALRDHGWQLDHVYGPQHVTLPRLTRYTYGIGVGRCALEMIALGLRVMVAGARFGGIVTSRAEWDLQRGVNFNGRIVTYDRSLVACAAVWDAVQAWPAETDAKAAADTVAAWIRGGHELWSHEPGGRELDAGR